MIGALIAIVGVVSIYLTVADGQCWIFLAVGIWTIFIGGIVVGFRGSNK